MKKMQKALALLTAILILAGCGAPVVKETAADRTKQDQGSQNETQTSAEKPVENEKQESKPAEAENSERLVYWSMWESSEPQGQVIKEAVAAFSGETGVEVDLRFKGRTNMREGLRTALEAGEQIDLFDEDISRVNQEWGDYLYDLTPLVEAAGYEQTGLPLFLQAAKESGGGRYMSLPYQPFIFNVFYNKNLFAKAGIEKEPATWEEFLTVCEQLKQAGIVPVTFDDAYAVSFFGYHLGRYIGQPGVEDVVLNGKWRETPEVLAVAADIQNMAEKGYFSAQIMENIWPAGQETEIAAGKAAMCLNGSWLPNEVKEITGPDFRWGCFSYPAVPGGQTDISYANYGAQVLAVNKNTKLVKEAFGLIEKITRGEYDAKLAEYSLGIPSDAANTAWPQQLEEIKPVLEQTAHRWAWAVNANKNQEIEPDLKENFIKLAAGKISAEEFVSAMEKAAEKK